MRDHPVNTVVLRRHLPGVVAVLLLLVVAREVWPYADVHNAEVREGWTVSDVTMGLGGPTCLEWLDAAHLLVCDRDGGQVHLLSMRLVDGVWTVEDQVTWLDGLDRPHDVLVLSETALVSESGRLRSIALDAAGPLVPPSGPWSVLIDDVPTGNHQPNAINVLPNGTAVWHVGSTCNVCSEADERNAALVWVNPEDGSHGVLASGVRNSFDGAWVPGVGYLFSDNGRDWDGDHPPEEVNLLVEGAAYGWPDDEPDTPVPPGTVGPVATWLPHSSLNGLAVRPATSSLPGGNTTVYATVYGSWNSVVPVGHEIVRIDLAPSADGGWEGTTTSFATNLGTPLPIAFHPDGDLFYATFGGNGRLHVIQAE